MREVIGTMTRNGKSNELSGDDMVLLRRFLDRGREVRIDAYDDDPDSGMQASWTFTGSRDVPALAAWVLTDAPPPEVNLQITIGEPD